MALHPGIGFVNSNTATGMRACLYDDGRGSRSTGKERDSESGLDYFGARYYGRALGRFTSPDWSSKPEPVPYADFSNPQTLNEYSYVLNNPLGNRDAEGHVCIFGIGNTCAPPPPLPAIPDPPKASPIAALKTDMKGQTTTFSATDTKGTLHETTIETHNVVARSSKPGAIDP
jgi:RHS repeat-associated protein